MTKAEFMLIASAIRTLWPRETVLPNERALDLWFINLQDLPYAAAEYAVNRWACTSHWAPTIADIRAAVADAAEDIPDWSDGWEAVLAAVHRFGIYREAEALAALPDIARDAARRLGWQTICLSENISVERANFRQIYEAIATRRKETARLPEFVTTAAARIRAGAESGKALDVANTAGEIPVKKDDD